MIQKPFIKNLHIVLLYANLLVSWENKQISRDVLNNTLLEATQKNTVFAFRFKLDNPGSKAFWIHNRQRQHRDKSAKFTWRWQKILVNVKGLLTD